MTNMINILLDTILFIWQLPQNIIGTLMSRKRTPNRRFRQYRIYRTWTPSLGEGMSLGNYIFVNPSCPEGNLIKHEFGHCMQSMRLGWLYLPVIFLPSYAWWSYFSIYCKDRPDSEYYTFYTETWADSLIRKRKHRSKR